VPRGSFPEIPRAGLLFGLGIDVIEAARIRRLLERLPRAYERLFSAQERAYCDGFSDPWPHYAARFAAKEAVGKALGIGIIGFVWRDIEVLSGGKPIVALHGGVARVAGRLGVTRIELSLSHTDGVAYAVAAALKGAGGPDAADAKEAADV
jgi:holo-[acyl-carrier protein] synthase